MPRAIATLAPLLALAALVWQPATHAGTLPLGDGHLSSGPQRGALYACPAHFRVGGARHAGPWIEGDRWDPSAKPAVQGDVHWPQAHMTITLQGDRRVITTNDLPDHATGEFPIARSDPAWRYDHNPNAIRAQHLRLVLPADPVPAVQPMCVPMGLIGIATDGTAIFDAVDDAGRDAVAHEVQDRCNGHPQHRGEYHYHGPSPCLHDPRDQPDGHSGLIGYMLDGFGLFGMYGEGGKLLTDADLDACHGHTHAIMWDGRRVVMYHYHLTREYPYTVGCFRGNVDPALLRRAAARQINGQAPGVGGGAGTGLGAALGARAGPEMGEGAGMGSGGGPPPGREAVLQRAAASLGVSAQALRRALGPPPPDFRRAARMLGVNEQALRQAMRAARGQ